MDTDMASDMDVMVDTVDDTVTVAVMSLSTTKSS